MIGFAARGTDGNRTALLFFQEVGEDLDPLDAAHLSSRFPDLTEKQLVVLRVL
jgi:hypothetical protein